MLIQCNRCEARVDAQERGEISDGEEPGRYVFLECPSCGGPIVAYQRALAMAVDNEIIWTFPDLMYPEKRSANLKIPALIRRSFEEALTCVSSGTYLAAAVMCRKTIEAVAVDKYGKGQTLAAGIERLHNDRVIDERLHEWAGALRKDGNFAAHDPNADISQEDAKDLVDFTEAILEYVYVLHARFEAYKTRRVPNAAAVAKSSAS